MKMRELTSPTIMDLPTDTIVDIILKLPLKTIISCKFVCKTWHELISSPNFVKLHFAQAKACLLLDIKHPSLRLLSLTDELEDCHDNLKLGSCRCVSSNIRVKCDKCGNGINPNALKRLQLCNAQSRLEWKDTIGKQVFKPESYKIVNSCNGLLCLAPPGFRADNDAIAVCNPVTGEFMFLPKLELGDVDNQFFVFGLGFSTKSDQYKVIMMQFPKRPRNSKEATMMNRCDTHTVGTNSWKSIGNISNSPISSSTYCGNAQSGYFPTYIDGTLYWLIDDTKYTNCIASFDFDNDKFGSYSVPPHHQEGWSLAGRPQLKMGVLRGRLCIYNKYWPCVDVWIMKEHGTWESWNKLYCIISHHNQTLAGSVFDFERPVLSYLLTKGTLLMHQYHPHRILMYYDLLGFVAFKPLEREGFVIDFEAIAHTPSLISLKDIVKHERL